MDKVDWWLIGSLAIYIVVGIVIHLATRNIQDQKKKGKIGMTVWAVVGLLFLATWFFTL